MEVVQSVIFFTGSGIALVISSLAAVYLNGALMKFSIYWFDLVNVALASG